MNFAASFRRSDGLTTRKTEWAFSLLSWLLMRLPLKEYVTMAVDFFIFVSLHSEKVMPFQLFSRILGVTFKTDKESSCDSTLCTTFYL